jgi:hypothetical protein
MLPGFRTPIYAMDYYGNESHYVPNNLARSGSDNFLNELVVFCSAGKEKL